MIKPKIYYLLRVLLVTAAGVGAGLFVLLWASAYAVEIFDILLIAIGVLGVVSNLPNFVLSLRGLKKKWEWINLIVSLAGIGLGVSFLFIRRNSAALPVLLVLYVVVLPIVRILLVEERKKQFRRELPKIFFGVFLLIVSLCKAEDTVFFAFGITLIAVSGLYLLLKLLTMRAYFKLYDEVTGESRENLPEQKP